MAQKRIQLLEHRHFPANRFFKHLAKGTDFYKSRKFDRSLEEWSAAGRISLKVPELSLQKKGSLQFGANLSELPLLFAMSIIFSYGLDGVVVVASRDIFKKLFFHKGLLVHASSTKADERIGRTVIERGYLAADDLEGLLEDARKHEQKIGKHLVQKSIINQRTLKELLALQMEAIIGDLLFWNTGHFYFRQGSTDQDAANAFTPLEISCAAARGRFSSAEFKEQTQNEKGVFRLSPYVESIRGAILKSLHAKYQFVFSLIDGTRNVQQIIRFCGMERNKALNALYYLCALGLIRRSREIVEYEDTEFVEINKAMDTIFEVYRRIYQELFETLGRRADEMVTKAVNQLSRQSRRLLSRTLDHGSVETSKNALLNNMATVLPLPQQRTVFIDCFEEYFEGLLYELQDVLGLVSRNEVAADIVSFTIGIERFSMETAMKKRLVRMLNKIGSVKQPA